jgi:hypothetical protein
MPQREFVLTQEVYHNFLGARISFSLRERPSGPNSNPWRVEGSHPWRTIEKQLFNHKQYSEREIEDITEELVQTLIRDALVNFKLNDFFKEKLIP